MNIERVRFRKKKHIDINFIFTDLIKFLVKSDRNTTLKMTPMILKVKDDPKTLCETISFRDIAFFFKKKR
jgi:hypothetical protein